jgi:signal transduction histidine kinase
MGARLPSFATCASRVTRYGCRVALGQVRHYTHSMQSLPNTFDAVDLDIAVKSAVDQARSEFADELHDSINAQCVGLRHHIFSLETQVAAGALDKAVLMAELANLRQSCESIYTLGRSMARRWEAEGLGYVMPVLRSVVTKKQALAPQITISIIDNGDDLLQMEFTALHSLRYTVDEAITNAIKYSGCKSIDILVESPQDGSLRVTIADDGATAPESFEEGFGVRMMRRRTEQMGGVFSMRKDDHGPGLLVRFDLPKEVLVARR